MRWRLNEVLGILLVALAVGQVQAAELGIARQKSAVFAGGCFWCMESEFESEKGVISTVAGYTGGKEVSPTYEQVSSGKTGHREAIEVVYDPDVINYARLLEIFWSNVDPLDAEGQFCDKGEQYKAGIYVANDAERAAAKLSADNMAKKLGKPVVTDIMTRGPFYTAEDYHQDFYKKSADKYWKYRAGCGRDKRLEELMK